MTERIFNFSRKKVFEETFSLPLLKSVNAACSTAITGIKVAETPPTDVKRTTHSDLTRKFLIKSRKAKLERDRKPITKSI
jgi:hypothetical protein